VVQAAPNEPTTESAAKGQDAAASATREAETANHGDPADTSAAGQLDKASAANPVETGENELALGRRYLEGRGGARDSAQAARWFWKAVVKHNTTALVLLADMYARGDGVAQNCDQARVLWRAAAERGNTEAADKLRSPGCQ
jgi:TPR repeat protein